MGVKNHKQREDRAFSELSPDRGEQDGEGHLQQYMEFEGNPAYIRKAKQNKNLTKC